MSEKKIIDLAAAMKDEAVDYTLSEVLPGIVQTFGEHIISEGMAQLVGGLLGAVCPRLNNIRLSYKQNRLERNVTIMLNQLIAKEKILSSRISALEATIEGQSYIGQCEELLLDGIIDEIQSEKVKYNVNGFINLIQTDDANMNMALMFFKTLYELSDFDIQLLTAYNENYTLAKMGDLEQDFRSNYQQLGFVKEKLYRLGLLRSRNEEITKKNLDMMIDYLQKSEKDNRSSKPKGIKLPSFKKPYTTDSYSITLLGRTLLQLISEQCDLSKIGEDENVDLDDE